VTKSAKLTQPLNQLFDQTVEQVGGESPHQAPAGGGSLLGKLGNFKALVGKKPKEATSEAA